jgi:cyanophycinase
MQQVDSSPAHGSTAAGSPARLTRACAPARSRTSLWALLGALLVAHACAPFALARESAPDVSTAAAIKSATGPAIAIGGALRDDNAAVWSRLIGLAGGPGARFVVLATASGDPEAAARGTIAALNAHGAVAEHLRVAPELKDVDLARAVRDPALIDKVRAANGVFFTGGDQARIVDTLRPGGVDSPLLTAIRQLQQRGGVIAGTSAGAAIMSRTMFRDPASVVTLLKGPLRPGQDFGPGLDFAHSGLFVDQHFLRRGRLGRMLPLMHEQGMTLGLGVEEDSAAILLGDQVEVLGPGGALLVDLTDATSDAKLGAFNLSNARLTYLGHGDRYDLRTRTLTPARAKLDGQFIDPRAADFKPYFEDAPFALDVLAAGVVLERMIRIVDGRATESRGLAFDPSPDAPAPRDLGFEFRFSRRADTLGWYDPVASADAYTLANVRLDVVPVRVAQPLFGPWHRP